MQKSGDLLGYLLTSIRSTSPSIFPLYISPLPLRKMSAIEAPHTREYFYVGGQYEKQSDGEHIMVNQMYVEKLQPAGGSEKPYPIIFIHGQLQNGSVGSPSSTSLSHISLEASRRVLDLESIRKWQRSKYDWGFSRCYFELIDSSSRTSSILWTTARAGPPSFSKTPTRSTSWTGHHEDALPGNLNPRQRTLVHLLSSPHLPNASNPSSQLPLSITNGLSPVCTLSGQAPVRLATLCSTPSTHLRCKPCLTWP